MESTVSNNQEGAITCDDQSQPMEQVNGWASSSAAKFKAVNLGKTEEHLHFYINKKHISSCLSLCAYIPFEARSCILDPSGQFNTM